MSDQFLGDQMLDMFIFETAQLLEQLEACILDAEKDGAYSRDAINEIFRIMHTLKGSSAMMRYDDISSLAHSIEDLFYFLREENPGIIEYSELTDLVLAGVDFVKSQIGKIKSGSAADDDASKLIADNREFLAKLKGSDPAKQEADTAKKGPDPGKQEPDIEKQNGTSGRKYANTFRAVIRFQEGCEMENIRAFGVIHNLEDVAGEIRHVPEDIMVPEAAEIIKRDGFTIHFRTDCTYVDIHQLLMQTIFLKELELEQVNEADSAQAITEDRPADYRPSDHRADRTDEHNTQNVSRDHTSHQNIISVPVARLDKLMDLMGEFVIAEAMVIQNPDLDGMELSNFQKAAQRLDKITKEIQDMVMSIRMVPLAATFQKMKRIVRDMCRKLHKEANLVIVGEETEVDKNIIEHISDPLVHLVRNALDHGIESAQERLAAGKDKCGTITLEAKSAGSDVLIIVRDDGRGLDREKILKKAKEKGMLYKPESEMTDKEIFNLVLLPSFSTKDDVTEFSGRGVGMDVVVKNIEAIGGSVLIDSKPNEGTSITMKIPLTLAIIDGMNIKVGKAIFTLPTISIMESFRPKAGDAFTDPEGNEMIMVRGKCYPVLRLNRYYSIPAGITEFTEGIMIMVEHDERTLCIFADELLGQQQIVVKSLPEYIRRFGKVKGLAGCTLLGDGNISLILDIGGLIYGREA